MKYLPLIFRKIRIPFRRKPHYIILHSAICAIHNPLTSLKIDNNKNQLNLLKYEYIYKDKHTNIPYHFLIEKINGDYETLLMTPLNEPIKEFNNLANNDRNIHVAIDGNFDYQLAIPRLYEVLAYRVLTPIMYLYSIPQSNILFHSDLDKEQKDCPGQMFYKDILLQKIQKYQIISRTK